MKSRAPTILIWFAEKYKVRPPPQFTHFEGDFCPVLAVDWLLVGGPRSFTVDFKFEVSGMYIFNFSEQKLHLLPSKPDSVCTDV